MITLYDHPLSPYAQKCKIALREKGVPFEARLPAGIGSGAGLEPAFLAANPRAEVPALVDGDVERLRLHDHPRVHRGRSGPIRRSCPRARPSARACA